MVFDGLKERWLLHEVRRQPRQYVTPGFAEMLVHERQELPSATESTDETQEAKEAKETSPAASGMMLLIAFLPYTHDRGFLERAQFVIAPA